MKDRVKMDKPKMPFVIGELAVDEIPKKLKDEGVEKVRFIEYYKEPGVKHLRFYLEEI